MGLASTCKGLKEFKYGDDDTPLVTDDGTCAGVKGPTGPQNFVATIHEVMADNFKPLSLAFIVLCVVQLLCILFSCCLICMNRADYDEEYRKKMEQQRRTAGNMTGTAQPSY